MRTNARFLVAAFLVLACGGTQAASGTTPGAHGELDRLRFNQLALELNLPLFWAQDADGDGAVDPDEVRTLLFYPSAPAWTEGGRFTEAFERAYAAMREADRAPAPDDERRRLLLEELRSVSPTLVRRTFPRCPDRTATLHATCCGRPSSSTACTHGKSGWRRSHRA
jgi:hypothetical protein